MQKKSTFSKLLVIIAFLIITISLTIFPIFSWGASLKNNIAIIFTLIFNQMPITSDFYQQLMNSQLLVSGYMLAILLVFNLTYFLPLIFIKKPFAKSLLAIYMLLMTLVLALFLLMLFNYFKMENFQIITFHDLWFIPWVGIACSLVTIFWYGLKNLWDNPRKLTMPINSNENKDQVIYNHDNLPTYQELKMQLKTLKEQLKAIKNIKNNNIS